MCGRFSSDPEALPLQCKSFRLCGVVAGEDSSSESARERERGVLAPLKRFANRGSDGEGDDSIVAVSLVGGLAAS